MESTINFLREKFGKKPEILDSNIQGSPGRLQFGDTTETFTTTYKVEKAKMQPELTVR